MESSECFRFAFIGGFFKRQFYSFYPVLGKKLVYKNSLTMFAKVLMGPHRNMEETFNNYSCPAVHQGHVLRPPWMLNQWISWVVPNPIHTLFFPVHTYDKVQLTNQAQ